MEGKGKGTVVASSSGSVPDNFDLGVQGRFGQLGMQGNIEGRKLYQDVRDELHPSRAEEHAKSKMLKSVLRDEEFIEKRSGEGEGSRQGELDVMRFENPGMAKLVEAEFEQKRDMMKNYRTSYEKINAEQFDLEAQKRKLEQQIAYNKKYLEKIKDQSKKMEAPQKNVDLSAYRKDDSGTKKPKKITDLEIDDVIRLIANLKN